MSTSHKLASILCMVLISSACGDAHAPQDDVSHLAAIMEHIPWRYESFQIYYRVFARDEDRFYCAYSRPDATGVFQQVSRQELSGAVVAELLAMLPPDTVKSAPDEVQDPVFTEGSRTIESALELVETGYPTEDYVKGWSNGADLEALTQKLRVVCTR